MTKLASKPQSVTSDSITRALHTSSSVVFLPDHRRAKPSAAQHLRVPNPRDAHPIRNYRIGSSGCTNSAAAGRQLPFRPPKEDSLCFCNIL